MSPKLKEGVKEVANRLKNNEDLQISELEFLRDELQKFADKLLEEKRGEEYLLMYCNVMSLSPALTNLTVYEINGRPDKWKKHYQSSIKRFKDAVKRAEYYSN
jgi:hypothetical protein